MKNKNLTFEKSFECFGHEGSEIAIDITSPDYVFMTIPVDSRAYLTGPAIDRLHAFEEIGLEPEELKAVLNEYKLIHGYLQKANCDPNDIVKIVDENKRLKECLAKSKQFDFDTVIDTIRTKRDCSVHIFMMGNAIKSIDIKPLEASDMKRWVHRAGFVDDEGKKHPGKFVCPVCYGEVSRYTSYCPDCGEQLGKAIVK